MSRATKVRSCYVRLANGEYAVQLPDDSRWGFSLHQAEGEWSQSWEGGFGLADNQEFVAVPKRRVPRKVRREMDWLFEEVRS